MSEREDNVYKAKLAEQAERYDGEYYFSDPTRICTDNRERSVQKRRHHSIFAFLLTAAPTPSWPPSSAHGRR